MLRSSRLSLVFGGLTAGLCLGAVLHESLAAPPPLPKYTFKSIGTLGGTTSTAEGINDAGDVVGISKLADGTSAPYVYTAAKGMQNLNVITDGPLDQARQPVFGPDRTGDGISDLYVVNGGVYHGIGGSVALCDGVSGRFVEYFIAPGAGGLAGPGHLLIGPDGDFYIPSNPPGVAGVHNDRVLRYDGATGALLGTFVAGGSGGLTEAHGLAFGNDVNGDGTGDLFVTDAALGEVLAYSGADGSFLRIFVTAGSGGINQPYDVNFVRDFDGDGVTDLLVAGASSGNVLIYSGVDGSFLRTFVAPQTTPQGDGVYQLKHLAWGPDGDLYVASFDNLDPNSVIQSTDLVLRFNGTTGASKGIFVPSYSGGMSGPAVYAAFDPLGNLYVNSVNTNQVLKFQGPNGANPGAFLKIFVTGVGFTFTTARDINGAGQIVGAGHPLGRRLLTGEVAAFRYTPPTADQDAGNAIDLGLPGNSHEEAVAINDSGDVAGHFLSPTDNHYHAFYWTESTGAFDLGTLSGSDTYVMGLTNETAGNVQICGYAVTSSGYRAWRYNTTTHTMQNLGVISGTGYSQGWDINDSGVEVGYAVASSKNRAFSRTLTGAMVDLGTLGGNESYAHGISRTGMIVGVSDTSTKSSSNARQAFLWTSANGMFKLEPQITNLPSSMKLKIAPVRFNGVGQMCGPAQFDPYFSAPSPAYILTPQ